MFVQQSGGGEAESSGGHVLLIADLIRISSPRSLTHTHTEQTFVGCYTHTHRAERKTQQTQRDTLSQGATNVSFTAKQFQR